MPTSPSRHADAVVALIDRVLAAAPTTETAYGPEGADDLALCWRCLGPAGDGPSGVCGFCRTVLLDEAVPPARDPPGLRAVFMTRPSCRDRFCLNPLHVRIVRFGDRAHSPREEP